MSSIFTQSRSVEVFATVETCTVTLFYQKTNKLAVKSFLLKELMTKMNLHIVY